MPEKFRANVQYDDWLGSSAADDADEGTLWQFLKDRQLLGQDETVYGMQISCWGPSDQNIKLTVRFLARNSSDEATFQDPITLRVIPTELSPTEFFLLFKRFSVTLSRSYGTSRMGILEGRSINAVEAE